MEPAAPPSPRGRKSARLEAARRPATRSRAAPGRSGIWRGTAMERMPSCTSPISSKMVVICCANQPEMVAICPASGIAMATARPATEPLLQGRIAVDAVPPIRRAFIRASVGPTGR